MDAEATIDTPVPAFSSGSLQSLNLGAYSLAELAELVNWTNAKDYQTPQTTPWVEAGGAEATATAPRAAVVESTPSNPFVEGDASGAEEAAQLEPIAAEPIATEPSAPEPSAPEPSAPEPSATTDRADGSEVEGAPSASEATLHDAATAAEAGSDVPELGTQVSDVSEAAAPEHAAEAQMSEVEDHFAAIGAEAALVEEEAAGQELPRAAAEEHTAAAESRDERDVESPQPAVTEGPTAATGQTDAAPVPQPMPASNVPTGEGSGSAVAREERIAATASGMGERSQHAGRPVVGAKIQPTQRTSVAGLPNRRAATMAAVENGETAALADYLRQLEGLVLDLNMQIAQAGGNDGDQADYTQRLCQRVIELSLENKALHEQLQKQQ